MSLCTRCEQSSPASVVKRRVTVGAVVYILRPRSLFPLLRSFLSLAASSPSSASIFKPSACQLFLVVRRHAPAAIILPSVSHRSIACSAKVHRASSLRHALLQVGCSNSMTVVARCRDVNSRTIDALFLPFPSFEPFRTRLRPQFSGRHGDRRSSRIQTTVLALPPRLFSSRSL